MTTPNAQKVHRVQGKVSWNPTNLATAWPHGGTGLGVVHSVALVPVERVFDVRAEEYGGEIVESVGLGKDWAVSLMIREYSLDALSVAFPSAAAGSSSGEAVVSEPGSIGGRLSSRAGILLFTPDDATKPGFVAYRAMPQLETMSRYSFGIVRELGFLMAFRAIRDGSNRVLKIGRLADLTL